MKTIRENFTGKKALAVILLVICACFIFYNRTCMMRSVSFLNGNEIKTGYLASLYEKKYKNAEEREKVPLKEFSRRYYLNTTGSVKSLKGNVQLKQKFTAEESRISILGLLFNNSVKYEAKGMVKVSIKDNKNKTIAEASLPANMLANDALTYFSFNGDTMQINERAVVSNNIVNKNRTGVKINKGDDYYLEISAHNTSSSGTLGIYTLKNDSNYIFNITKYRAFTYIVFVLFMLLLLFALFFVLVPIPWVQKKLKLKFDLNRIFAILFFYLTPLVAFYTIFKIDESGTKRIIFLLFSLRGVLNLLIIVSILWLLFAISNRYCFSAIVTQVIVFLFGVANYLLILFRNEPLVFNDLFLWKTAMQVAKSYSLVFNKAFLWAFVISIFWIVLLLALKEEKGFFSLKKRLIPIVVAACFVCSTFLVFYTDFTVDHGIYFSSFKPTKSYKTNGYLLGFGITVKNSTVKKPYGYDVGQISRIAKKYKSDKAGKAEKATKQDPNIIVVMNEAFSDLGILGDLKTNKDYMPYFRSLKKNTIKGTLHMSVFGGHTANSEFEFLTGNSIRFIPVSAVPYSSMLRNKIPSLAWQLRQRGYQGNIAFHPGVENSYNRDVAYPNLGFEDFLSLTQYSKLDKIRSYTSDKADYDVVINQYEKFKKKSSAPFFMFNVTIQNHGGYMLSEGVIKPARIKITSSEQKEEQAEQYLNLISLSDTALKDLIDYFSSKTEPTVIVMFGDHQPKVGDSFYNAITGKNDDQLSLSDIEKKYRVPFMIWANYDIEEKENVQMSANYLSSYMLKILGGKLTGYNKYLMDLYSEIPVISSVCYMDNNGTIYDKNARNKYTDKVNEYERIQYNYLNDNSNRVDGFYKLNEEK